MSIHGDICTVLNNANVAPGGAYPEFLPDSSQATEYVIVRRSAMEPAMTLQGYGGLTRSTFVFECWATGKERALTIAAAVDTAIDAATSLPLKAREPVAGEDYAPEVMELMEPRQYSIWHA